MKKLVIVAGGIVGLLLVVAVLVLLLAGPATGRVFEDVAYAPPAMPGEDAQVMEKVYVEGEAGARYAASLTASGADYSQTQIDRMIIWNADISLTVEDTEAAIEQAQAVAQGLGGYTVGTESWKSDDQLYARLTLRVPADKFEMAMAQLRDLALEVNRESANSEDVTDQYVDLDSRLRHLEGKEAQLIKFLEDAEDTEAVLAVYDHLAETQAEIEQVKGRMAYLEKLSAMATISVELYPEEAPPEIVDEGWKPGFTLRKAARALLNTLKIIGDVLIWIAAYLLPILLVLGIPVAGVVWVVRRRRRARSGAPHD